MPLQSVSDYVLINFNLLYRSYLNHMVVNTEVDICLYLCYAFMTNLVLSFLMYLGYAVFEFFQIVSNL